MTVRDDRARRAQEALGEVLAQCRMAEGYSLTQAAAHLGHAEITVRRWEDGRYQPHLADVILLADLYEVELGWIYEQAAAWSR